MANAPKCLELDRWRKYLRTANSGIFDVIKHAIMLAAADFPCEFESKRVEIAELLFTCKLVKCGDCNQVELVLPNADDCGEKTDAEKRKLGVEFGVNEKANDNKEDSGRDYVNHRIRDREDDHPGENNVNGISNQRYEDVEALSDEIEEEERIIDEVKKIKAMFDNNENEYTEIGKSVNALFKQRRSEEIQNLAKELIEDWKSMVNKWVESTATVTGAQAAKQDKEEEGLLPSPPMGEGRYDKGSVVSDCKIDIDIKNSTKDGMQKPKLKNPNNSKVHPGKIQESMSKPCKTNRPHSMQSLEGTDFAEQKFASPDALSAGPMKNKGSILEKEYSLCKPQRPFSGTSGIGRAPPPSTAFVAPNQNQ